MIEPRTRTKYAYDAINRLMSQTYSDTTPAQNYFYDEASITVGGTVYALTNTKARMSHTSAASGTAITIHSYDTMGRTQDLWQCTPFNCSSATIWKVHYTYNLVGDVTSWQHPAGETITQTISNARRVTQISSSLNDATHPATLAQNILYVPQGALAQLQDGCAGTGCTQHQETYNYNNRLQTTRIQLGTSATPNANACQVYNYYSGVANPSSCTIPSQAATGNNGTAVGHYLQDTTNPTLGHTVAYSYDTTMRLASSVATGSSTHNLTFSYDRYGNMTCVTNQNTNGPCPNYSFNASTNRITNTGFIYDAAGNLTADGTGPGTHTYQWDAENRLKSIDDGATASYTYNALGQRIEKLCVTYTEYIYDATGEELGEHNRTTWAVRVVDFRGRHLVHYQSNATYFNHANTLASTTQVTDYSGAVAQDQLFYPWGQDWNMVGTAQEKRFASLGHRDTTETGLDPTHFRMLSSTQGRWFSKDPVAGQVCDPQSMNAYAYVRNNSPNRTDPRGDLDTIGNYDIGTYYGPGNPGNGCQAWDASCSGAGTGPIFGGGYYGGFGYYLYLALSCPGTTDCSYYYGQCLKATTSTSKAYYCIGAPIVCQLAGSTRYANCVRLCLQRNDPCLNVPDPLFPSCTSALHATCFARCTTCLL